MNGYATFAGDWFYGSLLVLFRTLIIPSHIELEDNFGIQYGTL